LEIEVIFTKIADFLNLYPLYSRSVELLDDRALNDPDEQLRKWAQEQLQKMDRGK